MGDIVKVTDYFLKQKRRRLISSLEYNGIFFDSQIQELLVHQKEPIRDITIDIGGYTEDEYYKKNKEKYVPSFIKRIIQYFTKTSS